MDKSEIKKLLPKPDTKVIKLLLKASEIMSEASDPTHNIEHVKRLVKNALKLIKAENLKVDLNSLFLSIYWHDVWKSTRKPTLFTFFLHNIYEGMGSMMMFRKQAKIYGLDKEIADKTSYAIRKHSILQFFPLKSVEAKVLHDVDALDKWNPERVEMVISNMKNMNLVLFDMYILFMRLISFRLYFKFTRNEVNNLRDSFFEKMVEFRKNLVAETKTRI